MLFLKILEGAHDTGWAKFLFQEHDPSEVNYGDTVWSNGQLVEISENVDSDGLSELCTFVDNEKAFRGALRIAGIIQ